MSDACGGKPRNDMKVMKEMKGMKVPSRPPSI